MSWPDDRFADIGGRRLRYWDVGEGAPIVVESGMGTSVTNWSRIIDDLAKRGRVIAYDRAGLGASDRDPAKRTAGRMADDLQRLLDVVGVARPFVLIAHSWGGVVARLYAYRHPDDVRALVLIDSSHEDSFSRPLLAMSRVSYTALWLMAQLGVFAPVVRKQGLLKGLTSDEERIVLSLLRRDTAAGWREMAGVGESLPELAEARAGAELPPAIALSSFAAKKETGYVAKTFAKIHSLHAGLVDPSRGGYHLVAPRGVGHYIHLDAPQLVLDAVDHALALPVDPPSDREA